MQTWLLEDLNSNLRAEQTLGLWEWRQDGQWGLLPSAYLQLQWEILSYVNNAESGKARHLMLPLVSSWVCMDAYIFTHTTQTHYHMHSIHMPHIQTPLATSHLLMHARTHANKTTATTYSLPRQPSPEPPYRWYSQPESHKTLLNPTTVQVSIPGLSFGTSLAHFLFFYQRLNYYLVANRSLNQVLGSDDWRAPFTQGVVILKSRLT